MSATFAFDPARSRRLRILVVTADAGRAAILAEAASQATEGAAELVVRATGAAALEAVSAGVELCLFDLSDPVRLDLEACLAILRAAGAPRVVVVASEEQTPLAAQAVRAGAYEFQPMDVGSMRTLQSSLQRALSTQRPPEAGDGSGISSLDRTIHDLNNVLGGIVGLADLLVRDPDLSAESRERITDMRTSASRGVELVATLQKSSLPRRESEPGAGTSFEILLQRANETTGPDSTPDPGATTPRGTVLLVEDDEILRSTYEELLAGQGLHVIGAGDGFNALIKARSHEGPIDLLVSDILLPRMNGVQLWRKLSRHRPEAQVLFISGDLSQARGMIGKDDGAHHVLGKPFTATALLHSVQALLVGPPFPRSEGPAPA